MIANRNTYEIMSPEDVGWVNEGIIIESTQEARSEFRSENRD